MKAIAALILLALCSSCLAASVLTCEFSGELDSPWFKLAGDAQVADGVLKTTPLPGWERSGLFVGPLPMEGATWTIEYDVRPVALGAQCQEFVSSSPSTHWYMCYTHPGGGVNLHTRNDDGWMRRGGSATQVRVGTWHHVTVTLKADSIRLRMVERDGDKEVWDSGETAMQDVGRETVFGLVDESAEAVGQTEWDNLKVSTDDPDVVERMALIARELEAERREQARRQETARKLREAGIALIPTPREVELKPDQKTCPLTEGMEVTGCDEATRGIIAGVLKERLGIGTVSQQDGGGVHVQKINPAEPIAARGKQAYEVIVYDRGALLRATTPEGFFYAAQTLCQLADDRRICPGVKIQDWPAIENRLVMIAVSQGAFQVIDVEYWKRIIRELAAVKVNIIMPYFEGGTFYYEKYPFLGVKGRDGFTIEKGKILSEYAKDHFVQIVPQQNSLGHAGSILVHEELKDIREDGGTFCSSNPRTFEFLGDLFDDLIAAFPHARIHVEGDEFAHGFARCPECKARAEEIGKPGLYAEHMAKLREILASRNRNMMIWWHEEGYTEEAADKLDKDIGVFDWHYGNQQSYPSLERLQSLGFSETWATPAVTRYYDGRNDWDNTFGNISGFMRAGAARKVPGECTCTWVHGIWGGRNLFELNLYGVVFSAECAWNPLAADDSDFRWKFGRQWFGLSGGELEAQVMQAIHAPFGVGAEQKFWGANRDLEPIIAAPLAQVAADLAKRPELAAEAGELLGLCARARGVLETWERTAPRNRVTATYLLHDVHIHETVARKILAVAGLLEAYGRVKTAEPGGRQAILGPVLNSLRGVTEDYRLLEAGFERSVLEAGGGTCGWGGWWPFVAKGGIMFRAPEGRADLERQTAHLEGLLKADSLPEECFAP